MKVTREETGFKPINIRLETPSEVQDFKKILYESFEQREFGMRTSYNYGVGLSLLKQLMDKIQ